jgi:hypothetical protein
MALSACSIRWLRWYSSYALVAPAPSAAPAPAARAVSPALAPELEFLVESDDVPEFELVAEA